MLKCLASPETGISTEIAKQKPKKRKPSRTEEKREEKITSHS